MLRLNTDENKIAPHNTKYKNLLYLNLYLFIFEMLFQRNITNKLKI